MQSKHQPRQLLNDSKPKEKGDGSLEPSEGLSVGALVFAGPTVNVCGLHRIPFPCLARIRALHCRRRLSTVGRA